MGVNVSNRLNIVKRLYLILVVLFYKHYRYFITKLRIFNECSYIVLSSDKDFYKFFFVDMPALNGFPCLRKVPGSFRLLIDIQNQYDPSLINGPTNVVMRFLIVCKRSIYNCMLAIVHNSIV